MNGSRTRLGKKSKNFLETNENELKTIQNLWDTAKAVLRGKFIVIQTSLKKTETFQINILTLHLLKLEEQLQMKPRVRRRKEITKITAELNDIQTKSTIVRISKSRSWFFEKIKKIDKPLVGSSRKKERGSKYTELEMKAERLQLIPQKYEAL